MRSRAALPPLTRGLFAFVALASASLAALVLVDCATHQPRPGPFVVPDPELGPASAAAVGKSARPSGPLPGPPTSASDAGSRAAGRVSPAAATIHAASSTPLEPELGSEPEPVEPEPEPAEPVHCASAPTLLADGSVPPVPPHAPLGQDIDIPDDRPVYVLPGDPGDSRVIIYLHGMCGDATAADFFREAVRAHGTLIALRGDTPCANGRFKWRDDASKIQARIRAAFQVVNALGGGALDLERALLFGYSQGAERAERVAALYPKQYPRIVLGGPPTKASPRRLAHAERVAILGGELETTENMRAGYSALEAAGIASRFFSLDCAYHGYFGANPETQLAEVLTWVSAP